MALAKLPSVAVEGVEARPVKVEVDVASGLPGFVVVGLADKAVEESRERVRSALRHSGFSFPLSRITVHLAPSERKKTGVHFDLPIALGILLGDGQIKTSERLKRSLFIGGLSLDGQLQGVSGTLIFAEWAKAKGFDQLVLPRENADEAALVDGLTVIPLETFAQVIDWIKGEYEPPAASGRAAQKTEDPSEDWLQIQGQEKAKRAAFLAAAGGHNLLLEGPPGAGKTLLARGLRALLPPLSKSELIEVVKLHSVANQLKPGYALDGLMRPFRSPHHSASHIALVGGGTNPRPGEISLAHRGVLFMDELPEFPHNVVEALRQPLEDGRVQVARINQSVSYPAAFTFVGTMNPCPCGWLGSNQKECSCSPHRVAEYRKKVSGPILDRIDIYLTVGAVPLSELKNPVRNLEELETLRSRVQAVWELQHRRNGARLNAHLPAARIAELCRLDDNAEKLLDQAAQKFVITGRSYHKLLKVARTIADLADRQAIAAADIAEALQYRFSASIG